MSLLPRRLPFRKLRKRSSRYLVLPFTYFLLSFFMMPLGPLGWFLPAPLIYTLTILYKAWTFTPVALRSPHRRPMKMCVVLGSGGHTSEMLRAIEAVPGAYWSANRPIYVVSATDTHSSDRAKQQEQQLFQRRAAVYTIPRAREVGQSYLTSIGSTLHAVVSSFWLILWERPDVLLTNGPGVCIPVVAAALVVAFFAPWWYDRPAIVYMESFTCVRHLSLTGLLLAPFLADVFTVHWRSLEAAVSRYRLRGTLTYIGCEDAASEAHQGDEKTSSVGSPTAAKPPVAAETPQRDDAPYALVTVGSTQFAALVEAMIQPQLCAALKARYGITKLYVQHGTAAVTRPAEATVLTDAQPSETDASNADTQRWNCGGLIVVLFPYRPHLDVLIRHATLVITHAGAGTILEGLQARCLLVVVPNRQLMSDHQLELADGLAAGHFLYSLQVAELAAKLPRLDVTALRPHRGMDVGQLQEALQTVLTGSTSRSKSKCNLSS